MSNRILWLPAMATLIFLGTGSSVPALARGGSGSAAGRPVASGVHMRRPFMRHGFVASRTIVRQFGVQNRFRFGVQNGFRFGIQNGFPFGVQSGFSFGIQNGFPFGVQSSFPLGIQNGFPFGIQNGFPFAARNGFGFNRNAQLQGGWPIAGWPSWPFLDSAPIQVPSVASDAPSNPVVIVMSGLSDRAPERATPETPPDYGYIAGCHAIPNGYHCDIPHNEATP
jgi:hypothetical protein